MDFAYALVIFLALGLMTLAFCLRTVAPAERGWLGRILVVALLMRLMLATVFAAIPETRIFHEDAGGYEELGIQLASSWSGRGPPVPADLLQQNYGYRYVCAGIYYLLGPTRAAPSYLNCLLGTVMIFIIYRLARRLFIAPVAQLAAALCAFMPSMILWSAMTLKDTPVTFCIVVALASCLALKARFSVWALVGTVVPMVALQPLRFYMIYFVGFAVVASLLFERSAAFFTGVPKQMVVALAAVGMMVFVGILGSAEQGTQVFDFQGLSSFRYGMSITAQSGFAADVDVSTPGRALVFMPLGLSMLLFSPFPWQFTGLRPALTAPEMLVWWACIPSLWRGLRFAIRRRLPETSPILLFAVVLSMAYSLVHGNIGSGFRQRAQIFIFLFVFVALGYYVRRAKRRNLNPDELLIPTHGEAEARARVVAAKEAAAAAAASEDAA